jgi:proline dehydrogenase
MNNSDLDFKDIETAFASKSDEELMKMARIFGLMNRKWLVDLGSSVGLLAFRLRLPFARTIVKNTIYDLFCGGRTLLETNHVIDKLAEFGVKTILDYGAEGKEEESEFNKVMNETLRAIDFAEKNPNIPVVSTKVTGLTSNVLLEKISSGSQLNTEEEHDYESLRKRLDVICNRAAERGVAVYVDAEETWIQPAIDVLVSTMMQRYNKKHAFVFNTFQMYRHDRLDFLKQSHEEARAGNWILGAKIVRGAYMDKERNRAKEKGYTSPIQVDKDSTDRDYDAAVKYCVDHYEEIASCNASHNAVSVMLQAEMITKAGINPAHPHLHFSQLYGMSDNITFNLAKAGFNVSKYLPYGPVEDVIPYLIRRTQENTSVTGDMSRELSLILKELERRGL